MAISSRDWFVPEGLLGELQRLSAGAEGVSLSERARIVLLSVEGLTAEEIGPRLGVVPLTIYKWRKRFREFGIEGLQDLPRPGQPRKITDEKMEEILRVTREAVPVDAIRWSIRRVAQAVQASEYQVRSVWDESDVSTDCSRLMELKHELRTSGPNFELHAVVLEPPLCFAVISVGAALATTRVSAPPRDSRQGRGMRVQRVRTDGFFRAFDVAQGRAQGARDLRDSFEFLEEVVREGSRDQRFHVVFSEHREARRAAAEPTVSEAVASTHVIPSVSLFLSLLGELAGQAEVRAQTRKIQSSVFDLRASIQRFVEGPEGGGTALRWCAAPRRASKNSDWREIASAHRREPREPIKLSSVTWHSCDSTVAAGKTAKMHG